MQTLMNDNKQMGVNFDYKERLRKEHEARVQDSVNQANFQKLISEKERQKQMQEQYNKVKQQQEYKAHLDNQIGTKRNNDPSRSIDGIGGFTFQQSGNGVIQNGYNNQQQVYTSLPALEVNYNRFIQQVNDRSDKANSRMKKYNQYMDQMTRDPASGEPLYAPKERFLYYNDNLYQ